MKYRLIFVHVVAVIIKKENAFALLGFHDFKDYDSNPGFIGTTENSAWKTWILFKEAANVFSFISKLQTSTFNNF